MADDRKKRGVPDSKTINMNEDWEKEYWKNKFRVSGQACEIFGIAYIGTKKACALSSTK